MNKESESRQFESVITSETQQLNRRRSNKNVEVEELQDLSRALTEELQESTRAHQKERLTPSPAASASTSPSDSSKQPPVRALQQENKGSLRKLQETAEQFEWLCQQQRYWIRCIRRFKDRLLEEREALLQQVNRLERKAEKLRESSQDQRHTQTQGLLCPLQDTEHSDSSMTSWEADADADADADDVVDLECGVEKSNTLCEELLHQRYMKSLLS
ncbi:hypothetical protein INR49_031485 [Caranx melampygus]|nr:hypothetical protein INR49_031485 [Caranx melampygus]